MNLAEILKTLQKKKKSSRILFWKDLQEFLGIYCCVPQCGSALKDKHKQKSGISWKCSPFQSLKKTIGQYRRKGYTDTFKIKKTTHICEFNFQAKEIKVSLGVGRKTLFEGADPSIFPCKRKEIHTSLLLTGKVTFL